MKNLLKIAVIQDAPVLFDLQKTMEKTLRLTREAAEMGAKLIVFPESFIPCYPRGLTFGMVVGIYWLTIIKQVVNGSLAKSGVHIIRI